MLYMATDIETTDVKWEKGYIVEVGMAVLDTDDGAIEIVLDEVCREPGMTEENSKDAWIFQNSSLTLASVMASKNVISRFASQGEVSIYGKIQEYLKSVHGNTAFNSDFDFGWLQSRGLQIPNKFPCLMKFMGGLCKIPNPKKPGTFKHPKFVEAVKWAFGEDPSKCPKEIVKVLKGENHRAAHDAAADAALLKWILNDEKLSKTYLEEAKKIKDLEEQRKTFFRKKLL